MEHQHPAARDSAVVAGPATLMRKHPYYAVTIVGGTALFLLAGLYLWSVRINRARARVAIDGAVAAYRGPAAIDRYFATMSSGIKMSYDVQPTAAPNVRDHFVSTLGHGMELVIERVGEGTRRAGMGAGVGWVELDSVVTDLSPGDRAADWHHISPEQSLFWLRYAVSHPSATRWIGRTRLPNRLSADATRIVRSGAGVTLYFDPVSHLIAAMGYAAPRFGGKVEYPLVDCYSGYRDFAGFPLPSRIDTFFRSKLSNVTIVTQRRPEPVPPTVFSRPLTARDDRSTTIDLHFTEGQPLIRASIDGAAPWWFIVDTGAYASQLTPEIAVRLGLKDLGSALEGHAFSSGNAEITHLKSLRLGDVTLKNLTAYVDPALRGVHAPLKPFGGYLGFNILGRYCVTVDYASGRLILSPRPSPATGKDAIRIRTDSDGTNVVAVDGPRRYNLRLDTGSQYTFLPMEPEQQPRGVQRWLDGKSHFIKWHKLELPVLRVGSKSVKNLAVFVLTPADGSPIFGADLGLLGNSFLQHFRVTIDYPRNQLYLSDGPSSGAAQTRSVPRSMMRRVKS